MIKPTARLVLLVGSAIPVSIVLVLINGELWVAAIAWIASLIGLSIVDNRLALRGARVTVTFAAPKHLYIGEPSVLPVAISTGGRAPHLVFDALLDLAPTLREAPLAKLVLDGEGTARHDFPLIARRRGMADLLEISLRWRGPFGLTWAMKTVPVGIQVPVLPNIEGVRRAAIMLQTRGSLFGNKQQLLVGDGSEFETLREYQEGFNPRSIDWKQSAKHRALICKEFRAERNHIIILAIDSGRLMREPIDGVPRLDRAINAGLLLSFQALLEGDRIGIFAFDAVTRHYEPPLAGTRAFPSVQLALAKIDYSLAETNFTLGLSDLATRMNRRALVVLLTDFVDTVTSEIMLENIHRLSSRHLVLFVALRDPTMAGVILAEPHTMQEVARSVAASDIARDRNMVMERLRRMGVNALDVEPDRLDSSLISSYLRIKQRELI
jgi:uncharacterized protein (DUF58 family)